MKHIESIITNFGTAAPAEELPAEFPECLRLFYSRCDGLVIPNLRLEILSLSAARDWRQDCSHHPLVEMWDLLPLTDSNDSNPYCCSLSGPVAGRIVLLKHDDIAQFAFRNFGELCSAVQALVDAGASSLFDLEHTYRPDNLDRTEADDQAAEQILGAPADEYREAHKVALSLLSARSLGVLERHLMDPEIGETAERCLRNMTTPEARRLYGGHRKQYKQFLKASLVALQEEGFQVELRGEHLTMRNPRVGFNTAMLFREGVSAVLDVARRAAARHR